MSIIDVLEQDMQWLGQDGFPYLINEMEQSHRLNTIRFLVRRAEQLYAQKAFRDNRAEKRAERLLYDAPEEVWEAYEREQRKRRKQLPQDPEQWLLGTPCMQALIREARKSGAIPPDLLEIEG